MSVLLSFRLLFITPFFLNNFFFTDSCTTEIYTLSLHDALPIFGAILDVVRSVPAEDFPYDPAYGDAYNSREAYFVQRLDRKSTRLNSSHQIISYAVFCLKKKNNYRKHQSSQQTAGITDYTTNAY